MSATKSQEQSLLEAALRLESESERNTFLDVACANDPSLRRRLEELLAASKEADAFFRDDPFKQAGLVDDVALPSAFASPIPEKPGDKLGRYKLLQKIGEGGCGVVYMAEQEEPVRRRVALKVIKLGMDTKSVIARFEAERQALAMMGEALAMQRRLLGDEHPKVAASLDNLTDVLRKQGKLAEADIVQDQVSAIQKKPRGDDGPSKEPK